MKFIKPKIIISKCLEFDACRYDAQMINSKYVQKLKGCIDFETVCPEVEIGMGTPRKPIRIVKNKEKTLLYQTDTGIDFSDKMNSFSKKYLTNLNNIDGFILKYASPSCGLDSAKQYLKTNLTPIGKTSGFFASKVSDLFPLHPKEDEKRLNNPFIREYFYTSIFTIADFKSVTNMNTLYKFHSKHKYLFMAYNQILLRKMGNIAANKDRKEIKIILDEYYKHLLLLFSKKPRYPSNINTQLHVMGYFKNDIASTEKTHFLDMIELYRQRKVPISTVNSILSSWIYRFDNKYLMEQSFFSPFPIELLDSEKSRFQ